MLRYATERPRCSQGGRASNAFTGAAVSFDSTCGAFFPCPRWAVDNTSKPVSSSEMGDFKNTAKKTSIHCQLSRRVIRQCTAMGLLLAIAVSSLAVIMMSIPCADAAFTPNNRSEMRSKCNFPEPAKTVIYKDSGELLTKIKGYNPQKQEGICSLIDIAMLICCVAQSLFISKTMESRPVKLRKTRALSSGICAWLVAALFIVSASLAGAQTCPNGATGCSGPASNWDTSKVTSMRNRTSKYLTTF